MEAKLNKSSEPDSNDKNRWIAHRYHREDGTLVNVCKESDKHASTLYGILSIFINKDDSDEALKERAIEAVLLELNQ